MAKPKERRQNAAASDELPLFRAAIEAVGDAVIITSPELDLPGPVICYTNAAFTKMTGYTASEVIGRTPRLLQGPKTDRKALDRLRAELASGGSFRGDGLNYRKDGSTFVIDWTVTSIKDASGKVTGWMSIQRDITERRHGEQRQLQLIAELQHRTRNLIAVVASIAQRTLSLRRPMDTAQARLMGRLGTLARVHGLLARRVPDCVTVGDLIRSELDACELSSTRHRIALKGSETTLPDATLQTLALAFHELAVNSHEHGALATNNGRLKISWNVVPVADGGPRLLISWTEDDVATQPDDWNPDARGYGRSIIEQALPHTLQAKILYTLDRSGLCCTIDLPLTGHRSLNSPS